MVYYYDRTTRKSILLVMQNKTYRKSFNKNGAMKQNFIKWKTHQISFTQYFSTKLHCIVESFIINLYIIFEKFIIEYFVMPTTTLLHTNIVCGRFSSTINNKFAAHNTNHIITVTANEGMPIKLISTIWYYISIVELDYAKRQVILN